MDKIDPVSRPSASERVRKGTEACVGQILSSGEEITINNSCQLSERVINSPWPAELMCVSLLKLYN